MMDGFGGVGVGLRANSRRDWVYRFRLHLIDFKILLENILNHNDLSAIDTAR